MARKIFGVALLVIASCGCRMCSDCCDDLPPVLDGPYPISGGRVGTIKDVYNPAINEADEIADPREIQLPTETEAPAEAELPAEIAPQVEEAS